MDWLEAVVHTTTMGADIVSEMLMEVGAVGTMIEDRYDVTSSKKEDGMWDLIDEDVLAKMSEDVLVKAYFKDDMSAQETRLLVQEKLADIGRIDMGFDMGRFASKELHPFLIQSDCLKLLSSANVATMHFLPDIFSNALAVDFFITLQHLSDTLSVNSGVKL